MPRDVIVPKEDRATYDNFHFAPAVRTGDLVLLSGQIGATGGGVPDSAEEEFRLAWQGVGRVLAAAGLGFEDVVEITTYHVNLQQHLATFMKVKDEFVGEPWPAWTAIGITELAIPGARVEIRVTAAE
ncbi:MAG: RidA family protein [Gammaproteobacteria bacterium]|nr:RidA family protein [Gammaproteobacteria bacterium]